METKPQANAQAWDLFRSPCCGQPLQTEKAGLRCGGCNRVYPVTDGIPVLLPGAAFTLCTHCGQVMKKDEEGRTSCPNCGPSQKGEAL